MPATVTIESVDFLVLDERGVVDHVLGAAAEGRGLHVLTVNVDILRRLRKSAEFRDYVGDYVAIADGMPIVWASALQGERLPARVSGSDLIGSLTVAATGAGRRVLLLGGVGGAAEAACVALVDRGADRASLFSHELPNPMPFERAYLDELAALVQREAPDVVFVSLGSPKGERLISELRGHAPAASWLSVGAAFDFLAGRVDRAPRAVRDSGLEWFHRLSREPGRLGKRYLVDDAPFVVAMLARAAGRGIGSALGRKPA